MRMQRRPKPAAGPLEELHPRDLRALAEAGLITWADVNRIEWERFIRDFGYDPYAHLRQERRTH